MSATVNGEKVNIRLICRIVGSVKSFLLPQYGVKVLLPKVYGERPVLPEEHEIVRFGLIRDFEVLATMYDAEKGKIIVKDYGNDTDILDIRYYLIK